MPAPLRALLLPGKHLPALPQGARALLQPTAPQQHPVHTHPMEQSTPAQQQPSPVQQLSTILSVGGHAPRAKDLLSFKQEPKKSSRQQLESAGCQRGCSTERCSWLTERFHPAAAELHLLGTDALAPRARARGRRDERTKNFRGRITQPLPFVCEVIFETIRPGKVTAAIFVCQHLSATFISEIMPP